MPTISLTDPVNGTLTDAALIAANNALLEILLNGGLDNSNVAAAAGILASKIAGFPSDPTKFLRGDGNWTGVSGASGTELDYKQITTDVVTSATTDPGAAIITGNSVTYDGSRVRIEFYAPQCRLSGGTVTYTFVLSRDSTVIGYMGYVNRGANAPSDNASHQLFFDTPPAGAHVYKVSAFGSNASFSLTVEADVGGPGKSVPAFLRVTRA